MYIFFIYIAQNNSVCEFEHGPARVEPSYCYYETRKLKFNAAGTNTGVCTTNDVCLCVDVAGSGGTNAPTGQH